MCRICCRYLLFFSLSLMFAYPFNSFSLLCTCIPFLSSWLPTCFSNTHHFIFLVSQPLRIFLDDIRCFFFFSSSFCNSSFKKVKKTPTFLESSISSFFFWLNLLVLSFIDCCTLSTTHIHSSDVDPLFLSIHDPSLPDAV